MAGKITALRTQPTRRNRVNVFLDGAYAFSLSAILAIGLQVGRELSDQDIAALQGRDLVEMAYERALHYLSFRSRSRREVEVYLRKHQVDEATTAQVIERLQNAGLINDQDFARAWVESREAFRPRGRRALRAELRQKGVTEEAIETSLSGVDEEASAQRVAERVAERWAQQDKNTFMRRIMGFLQRRGFGYDISRRVAGRLWEAVSTRSEPDPEYRAWPDNDA